MKGIVALAVESGGNSGESDDGLRELFVSQEDLAAERRSKEAWKKECRAITERLVGLSGLPSEPNPGWISALDAIADKLEIGREAIDTLKEVESTTRSGKRACGHNFFCSCLLQKVVGVIGRAEKK